MRNLTPATITKAFAEYAKKAPGQRTRQLWSALPVTCTPSYAENKLTQAEWIAGIDA
jgi:hypothetical protein